MEDLLALKIWASLLNKKTVAKDANIFICEKV